MNINREQLSQEQRLRLAKEILLLLASQPHKNKHEIRSSLELMDLHYSTSQINSVLYSYLSLLTKSDDILPYWDLRPEVQNFLEIYLQSTIKQYSENGLLYYRGHKPRAWQNEALSNWQQQGRRGVIEAVTGTGKTTVGILAAADAMQQGHDVLIIVPGLDLLTQWVTKLREQITDDMQIGELHSKSTASFKQYNIIVSTIQSAWRNQIEADKQTTLLIADEVHRYGAGKFAKALRSHFTHRLGLTATFERTDDGVAKVLEPFFKPRLAKGNLAQTIIHGCGYARGLADEILAPFRIGLIGVDLDDDELELYLYLDSKITKLFMALINEHNCPVEPFGEFMKAVILLCEGNNGNPIGTKIARNYINAFNQRRELLSNTNTKLESIQRLIPVVEFANKTLVFTQTIESAENVAEVFNDHNIPSAAFSSNLANEERIRLLDRFREGYIKTLSAPKVLDEGIDVPEADVGIIISASHSKRQMIQRMGRIIRPKIDNRHATFYIIYARNTNEDPAYGTHENFLNEMYDHAMEVKEFPENPTASVLLNWHQNS
jgi:RNA polymerase primary sigma factor